MINYYYFKIRIMDQSTKVKQAKQEFRIKLRKERIKEELWKKSSYKYNQRI